MQVEVIRTYLQMIRPDQHQRVELTDPRAQVVHLTNCPPSFYRYLYIEVGSPYHWIDRLGMSDEDILQHLKQDSISFFVLYVEAAPAGYFELKRNEDGSIELVYFGLLKDFLGQGLGKQFLSYAIDRAWKEGANRVWLHTCTLDNPAAMPNYLKRGFVPFKQETYLTTRV
jgi:GNAT superfamily N-acetyltransferase